MEDEDHSLRITAVILSVIFLCSPAWATTKTVCDSGCDNTTIAAALTAVGNGAHTITVQGTYTGAESITISQSGTDASNRLTIQASGTQTVKRFMITGSYLMIDGFTFDGHTGQYDGMVQLGSSVSYVTIRDGFFNNTGVSTGVHPIVCKTAAGGTPSPIPDNILIDNNEFDGQTYYIGINMTNSTFSNNIVHDNAEGTDAMWIFGHDNLIDGNEFYNIDEVGETHTDIVQTAGTVSDTSYNITWNGNYIHDNVAQGGNLTNDTKADLRDWTFTNNIYANMTYRFNVGISGAKFYNNTFYNCATDGGNFLSMFDNAGADCADQVIKNNIFIGGTTASTGWYGSDCVATLDADYNYVATMTTYAEKTGFSEAHGVNGGDPHLFNIGAGTAAGYALTENSTILIGKGVNMYSLFTDDYAGTTRADAAFDIGAYDSGTEPAETGSIHGITSMGVSRQ